MSTPLSPAVPLTYPRSECVYRSLTVAAMILLLASLWVF